MLFNSIQFLSFLPIVISIYYLLPQKYRWILLLAASYYFYMAWSISYILIIVISTLVTFFSAFLISNAQSKSRRKFWFVGSLIICLGILVFFKYFNFIAESLNRLDINTLIGVSIPYTNLLLPVGISFYTFQSLSYLIDVYRGNKKVESHLGIYALYVSFFPQLVAGPIERSTRLLPQFHAIPLINKERIVIGLKTIILGYFYKVVVADRLAIYVDSIYSNPELHQSYTLILATIFFSFQIYCDFAGYSYIAIGVAKLFGYDLMTNFRRPYLSISIRDFWSRWHISLSTWFRDYVYIPLGETRSLNYVCM